MNPSRLPSLKAVQAFEAAGRHLSIKSAADELHVTPSAVSQLILSLEDRLGVRLFQRINRGLVLTEAGQRFLPPVSQAFRRLAKAAQDVAVHRDSHILTVSVMPNFATSWLIPRLARFGKRHPEIDLRIDSSRTLTDFRREAVDMAIRHGLGRYPGLRSDRLMALEMVPVAAPELLEDAEQPERPADLLKFPLLHESARTDWGLWLDAQGVDYDSMPTGISFDDETLLIGAAVSGLGVALVRSIMVRDELASGRLVSLSTSPWPKEFAYYCVCPEENAEEPKILAFRNWLLEECRDN